MSSIFNKKIKDLKFGFLMVLFLGCTSLGWIDPLADKIREGNQFYHKGKYDEALDKYINAQINVPDITQLDFNMADAQYKRSKYNEASQLFEKALKFGDAEMKAKSSFNMGNTLYRQGKMKESLECYKNAVDFAGEREPKDGSELDTLKNNAKYNYEYVERKMKEAEQKQQQQSQDQKKQQEKRDNKDKKEDQQNQQKEQDNKEDQQNEGKGEDKEKQESQNDKQEPKPEDTKEKDKSKKDESKNDESESQSGEDKQNGQQGEQQQPQSQGQRQMSKEEAERFLEALSHAEKETRLMKKETQHLGHRSVDKDW